MKSIQKIFLALFALGFIHNNSFATAGKNGPQIGDAPPSLILSQVVQGPRLKKIAWDKLKGKVVVLEFWNTACAPCIQAIPHLNQLVEQFSNQVVFISISDDNVDYLKKFLKERPIKSWVVLDGFLNPTRTAFDVHGIPHTVIVDASGRIAAITYPALLQAKHLEAVLTGKPSGLPAPQLDSPDNTNVIIIVNPIPTNVEISITGPFPMPHGAYDSRGWNKSKTFPDFEARKALLTDAVSSFYDISPNLLFEKNKLPKGLYDISASAPPNCLPELKRQFADKLKTIFGSDIRIKEQDVNVYVLTVISTNAPGIKKVQDAGGGGGKPGGFYLNGTKMDRIALFMENFLSRPVINETGLTGFWSVDVKWQMTKSEIDSDSKPNPAKVIQAIRDQLGLELSPTNRTLEVLEINK